MEGSAVHARPEVRHASDHVDNGKALGSLGEGKVNVQTQTSTPVDWQPGRTTLATWNGLAFVLLVVGLILFSVIHAQSNDGANFKLEGAALIVGLLLTVVLTFALMIVHEGIHGLVMTRFGASPSYGAMMMGKLVPVFYCTAPGELFTRSQFMAIALAPAVAITIVSAVMIAFAPRGGWLVIPAAMHLAGCVGDFGMTAIVARQPPRTMIEDLKTGMRFHQP